MIQSENTLLYFDPTGMCVMNSSNETMLGKVFVSNPDDIELPVYENMYFVDADDEDGYRKTADKSNLMVEGLSEDNPIAFGQQYFKLPSYTVLSEYISDHLDEFEKD